MGGRMNELKYARVMNIIIIVFWREVLVVKFSKSAEMELIFSILTDVPVLVCSFAHAAG